MCIDHDCVVRCFQGYAVQLLDQSPLPPAEWRAPEWPPELPDGPAPDPLEEPLLDLADESTPAPPVVLPLDAPPKARPIRFDTPPKPWPIPFEDPLIPGAAEGPVVEPVAAPLPAPTLD